MYSRSGSRLRAPAAQVLCLLILQSTQELQKNLFMSQKGLIIATQCKGVPQVEYILEGEQIYSTVDVAVTTKLQSACTLYSKLQ